MKLEDTGGTWMKSRMSSKTVQIGILILDYILLITKKSLFNCHQHNSYSFDQVFLKLADKANIGEITNKFEAWPDLNICLRVTSP